MTEYLALGQLFINTRLVWYSDPHCTSGFNWLLWLILLRMPNNFVHLDRSSCSIKKKSMHFASASSHWQITNSNSSRPKKHSSQGGPFLYVWYLNVPYHLVNKLLQIAKNYSNGFVV